MPRLRRRRGGAGCQLFEGTPGPGARARAAAAGGSTTPGGALLAERLVLCQSAYPPRLVPALARATLPVFTYVIVTAPLAGRHAGVIRAPYAVYDNRFATGYYRLLPDGRLLWGGRISTREHPRDLAALMRRDLALVYPQLADVAVDYAWSGRMGFARHKMPLIRELAPGLWVNTCFGGHGLNTTTMGGELVASAIAEGDRRWQLLAPVRAALGRRRPRPARRARRSTAAPAAGRRPGVTAPPARAGGWQQAHAARARLARGLREARTGLRRGAGRHSSGPDAAGRRPVRATPHPPGRRGRPAGPCPH